ncbi:sugar ABC transporter substrate-binding protein [Cohnella mopanensis]|uniref:sugar ABC transporter substrate-binding protein n=1 Tax=Cohnella mopanensis TaxID=2911966 RepID=UPI001EF93931|nr:substrate-binding domain-containing protein [Cohnella mopanensis]
MRKVIKAGLLSMSTVLLLGTVLAGCGSNNSSNSSPSAANASPAAATDYKLAWYASAPHPYFEEVKKGVVAFENDFGIPVEKQIGPDWNQPSETDNVQALAAKGYKYFSIYPSDGSGANGLYEELTARGVKFVNFGASTVMPTPASFFVGTDAKAAAMQATEKLISLMGGKGNIVNVLEVLEDSNTKLRKEGVEEVVKKYPDVHIIQEISGMKSTEEAVQKVDSAIAANIDKVDGIIATGFTPSVAIAQVMDDYKKKGGNRTIHSIGMDTDPIVIKAIKDGVMDATIAQNSYGAGYLSMLLLKLMADGYTPKQDAYAVDGGIVVVTKDNVDTYEGDIRNETNNLKNALLATYLEKK